MSLLCEAKEFLQDRGLNHKFRDLENNTKLMLEYVNKYNWQTVPMIFHFAPETSPVFLGGYSDLVSFVDDAK